MAKAYYSITFDHSADAVWAVIRDFGHYGWAGAPGETVIENGGAATEVGAVRCFRGEGNVIRQVLLAHSDRDRSYVYAFSGPPTIPVENYCSTIRVTPVTAENRAFVEWSATFDCAPDRRDAIVQQLEAGGFAKWLAALKDFMSNGRAAQDS